MMPKRVIILANGSLREPDSLRRRVQAWSDATVVAADGGLQHAEVLGLQAQALVGDLDSLPAGTQAQMEASGVQVIRAETHKDATDLELALQYAASQGALEIALVGAWGARLDMSVANLLLLLSPTLSSLRVEIWDADQTAWVMRPPGGQIPGKAGDTLSLIPLSEQARGIHTTALAYPLAGETLTAGAARGVSNVLTGPLAEVHFESGALLVVHTPGRA
jgi:thiamine pyrophosphokinase